MRRQGTLQVLNAPTISRHAEAAAEASPGEAAASPQGEALVCLVLSLRSG